MYSASQAHKKNVVHETIEAARFHDFNKRALSIAHRFAVGNEHASKFAPSSWKTFPLRLSFIQSGVFDKIKRKIMASGGNAAALKVADQVRFELQNFGQVDTLSSYKAETYSGLGKSD